MFNFEFQTGKNPTEAEFKALLEEFGKTVEMIDFSMFKTAYSKKFKTPMEQDKPMRDAFKFLDADNDGTISEAELRQMLLTVGEPLTHQEVILLCFHPLILIQHKHTH